MNLEALKAKAELCMSCGLHVGRTQVVFGEGHSQARLMIVGEGPGADEDASGRPFVGKAGQLLDRILSAAGILRANIYITNMVKCRPPGNRNPQPEEAATCTRLWLNLQIELIAPQVIVTLGSVATQFFLDSKLSITRARGQWTSWNNIRLLPMFHPAYLLRNPSRAPGGPKALTWQDIREVKRVLDELGPKEETGVRTTSQESLF